MTLIILASLMIMLSSLVGVILLWPRVGSLIDKNLHYFVSLAAGVFLFVAYHLGVEAWAVAPTFFGSLLWILIGVLLIWLVFKLLPGFHHHDSDLDGCRHKHLEANKIILSDALHNIGDGLLLASAFAVDRAIGLSALFSILIHEIIQEVSEFFILIRAGYTVKKALFINFLASSTILIGSIGGFFFLEKITPFKAPLLGLTSGFFLIVIIQDLFPHSLTTINNKKHAIIHLACFSFGLLIMLLANFCLAEQ